MPSLALIGIDLGGTKCHGVVTDARGTILGQSRRATSAGGARDALQRVWVDLNDEASRQGRRVVQTVVGVPAVVEQASGEMHRGPNVGWDGVDASTILDEVGPVAFENDANLAALGELTACDDASADFVLLSIGTGFGGAVVAGGRIIRGRSGGAGEFGEVPLGLFAPQCDPRPARLEDLVSGNGIARAACAAQEQSGRELAFSLDAQGVFEAAQRGDVDAAAILLPVLDRLGLLIAVLACICDPQRVIFDGSVGRGLAPFADRIVAIARRWVGNPPEVRMSRLAPTSTLRGAIELGRALGGLSDTASHPSLWGLSPRSSEHA